jgi:hypothetical protein
MGHDRKAVGRLLWTRGWAGQADGLARLIAEVVRPLGFEKGFGAPGFVVGGEGFGPGLINADHAIPVNFGRQAFVDGPLEELPGFPGVIVGAGRAKIASMAGKMIGE